jgi:hypothetical protein
MSVNIKILREARTKNISESKAEVLLDAVNSVVSGLPMGHKYRNNQFAKKILSQIYEIFLNEENVSRQDAKKAIYKIVKGIQIL